MVGAEDAKIRATVTFNILVPKGEDARKFIEKCFNGTVLEIVEIIKPEN